MDLLKEYSNILEQTFNYKEPVNTHEAIIKFISNDDTIYVERKLLSCELVAEREPIYSISNPNPITYISSLQRILKITIDDEILYPLRIDEIEISFPNDKTIMLRNIALINVDYTGPNFKYTFSIV